MTVFYLKQTGFDTQSIERLLEANRKQRPRHSLPNGSASERS